MGFIGVCEVAHHAVRSFWDEWMHSGGSFALSVFIGYIVEWLDSFQFLESSRKPHRTRIKKHRLDPIMIDVKLS